VSTPQGTGVAGCVVGRTRLTARLRVNRLLLGSRAWYWRRRRQRDQCQTCSAVWVKGDIREVSRVHTAIDEPSTVATPRRAAASAPATASGSCTTKLGAHRSARSTTPSAMASFTAPNSSAAPRVPARPANSALATSGCPSNIRPTIRPKLNLGAMSSIGNPMSPAIASPAVATNTSCPAARSAWASGTKGNKCPSMGADTTSTRTQPPYAALPQATDVPRLSGLVPGCGCMCGRWGWSASAVSAFPVHR
jgi:hypothetical protein